MNQKKQKEGLTRRKFLKWSAGGLVGAGAVALGLTSWSRRAHGTTTVTQTRPAMGTFVEITASGRKERKVNQFIDRAYDTITEVDRTMSVFKGSSSVYKVNQPGEVRIGLTPDTFQVLSEAQEISQLTNGSFDVTSGPLLKLWGFYDGDLYVPSEEELERRLNLVDYEKITLNPSSVTLPHPKARIDLGGIAKGYAVDKGIEVLKEGGLQAGLINAGGDIRVFGAPEGRPSWKVGLQNPLRENEVLSALNLYLSSITTSGNYESFFTYRGNKLAHIINPRTGRPVEDVLSVSVMTEKAVRADGLSTGLFSQGKAQALNTIEKLDDTELIYIYRNQTGTAKVELSEGLASRLEKNRLEVQLN